MNISYKFILVAVITILTCQLLRADDSVSLNEIISYDGSSSPSTDATQKSPDDDGSVADSKKADATLPTAVASDRKLKSHRDGRYFRQWRRPPPYGFGNAMHRSMPRQPYMQRPQEQPFGKMGFKRGVYNNRSPFPIGGGGSRGRPSGYYGRHQQQQHIGNYNDRYNRNHRYPAYDAYDPDYDLDQFEPDNDQYNQQLDEYEQLRPAAAAAALIDLDSQLSQSYSDVADGRPAATSKFKLLASAPYDQYMPSAVALTARQPAVLFPAVAAAPPEYDHSEQTRGRQSALYFAAADKLLRNSAFSPQRTYRGGGATRSYDSRHARNPTSFRTSGYYYDPTATSVNNDQNGNGNDSDNDDNDGPYESYAIRNGGSRTRENNFAVPHRMSASSNSGGLRKRKKRPFYSYQPDEEKGSQPDDDENAADTVYSARYRYPQQKQPQDSKDSREFRKQTKVSSSSSELADANAGKLGNSNEDEDFGEGGGIFRSDQKSEMDAAAGSRSPSISDSELPVIAYTSAYPTKNSLLSANKEGKLLDSRRASHKADRGEFAEIDVNLKPAQPEASDIEITFDGRFIND